MVSTRKVVAGTVTAVAGVAAAAAAGVAVTMPSGVDGPGAMLAELQGHTETRDYRTADAAPAGLVPDWTRDVGSAVTVVRPGDAAGDDSGSVRATMELVPGTTPPADCTALPSVGMPFDGGGSWPDLGDTAQLCDGWVTVVLDGQLYTWTADDLQAEAAG
ncbi:hypothetical protein [Modestobacter versicolor]|uniref:Uncharacterized protein n=1 Tax=Modestobacter versicolor TaxID=429133 RepID=A0A323VRJ8_9ACTN|nr:hypothetical protein [Modestobacter versicolor]MBB3677578.1 hypothetical protein [Modestobacter versicolor]PZA21748.1 hypothetical protein DMO24_08625 [Modestobacter versicolor]